MASNNDNEMKTPTKRANDGNSKGKWPLALPFSSLPTTRGGGVSNPVEILMKLHDLLLRYIWMKIKSHNSTFNY